MTGRGFGGEMLFATLAGLLSLALLGGAAWALWAELSFRATAVMTVARVAEMRPSHSRDSDGRSSTVYYPVFEFTLPDGRVVQGVGPVGSGEPCCAVGDAAVIRYDPANPRRAAQDSFVDAWLLPTVLGVFGSLWLGATILVLTLGRADARTRPILRPTWWNVSRPAHPAHAERALLPVSGVRRTDTAEGPRWIVTARMTDPLTHAERYFDSTPLPFDPAEPLRRVGTVLVEYDPAPHGAHVMELSFLRPPGAVNLP